MSAAVRNCANCGNGVPVALEQEIECHGAPPAVVPAFQQTTIGPQQVFVAIWPRVSPAWHCGAWIERRPIEPPSSIQLKPGEKP